MKQLKKWNLPRKRFEGDYSCFHSDPPTQQCGRRCPNCAHFSHLHVFLGARAVPRALGPRSRAELDGTPSIQRRRGVAHAAALPHLAFTAPAATATAIACLERETFLSVQGDRGRGPLKQLHADLQKRWEGDIGEGGGKLARDVRVDIEARRAGSRSRTNGFHRPHMHTRTQVQPPTVCVHLIPSLVLCYVVPPLLPARAHR